MDIVPSGPEEEWISPPFEAKIINGELIGGADIISQMHENGELKTLIDSVES